MLVTISPAKLQDFESKVSIKLKSQALFMDEANYLISYLKDYDTNEIAHLLGINPKQAMAVFQWFQGFDLSQTPQKQAVFAYNGMVFLGLDAKTFSVEDLRYAQEHLMLFSALYGVLRPCDLIKPYRLDLTTKLSTERGNNLYSYWSKQMNEVFIARLIETGGTWVNLASHEYSKIIDQKAFPKGTKFISAVFKEQMPNGTLKQIVVYTKKARGLMARFILQNRIENIEEIKLFEEEGYQFSPTFSTKSEWVFTR